MTLAEKILARHAGLASVKAGQIVMAKVDLAFGTDVTTALSVEVFHRMGAEKVFDTHKLALVNDHFVPAKDVQAAALSKAMREFAQEQGITNYFEVGRSGICHSLLPDKGLVFPGDLIVGADSHTCTYGALGAFATGIGSTDLACAWALGELWFRVPESIKVVVEGRFGPNVGAKDLILKLINTLTVDGALYQALEFTGSSIRNMSMDGRITVCNMAIEAGAKTGLIAPDETTWDFIRGVNPARLISNPASLDLDSDPDAVYSQVVHIDLDSLTPLVAEPYLPSNVRPIKEVTGIKVDQVVIGSCTNGRLEDFQVAAAIMQDRPVHPGVRLLLIPATPQILIALIESGLAARFVKAGATLSPPTCGPCIGGHMGVLAKGEVGLFTTNRNFRGRNGHPESKVYLSGPQVAAATAVKGVIADPNEI